MDWQVPYNDVEFRYNDDQFLCNDDYLPINHNKSLEIQIFYS